MAMNPSAMAPLHLSTTSDSVRAVCSDIAVFTVRVRSPWGAGGRWMIGWIGSKTKT